MNGVTRVVGPVDPEAARWASGLNDPATGRLAIVVPPGLPSLAALVGELLGALGKRADRNPLGAAGAETLELGLAWLGGHRIDRIVLVHADWLREEIAMELCAYAATAGVELACIVGDRHRDPFLPWATAEQAWFEFVAHETESAGARAMRATDPAAHQLDLVGRLGRPAGRARVPAAEDAAGSALAAYVGLAGRIRLNGRTDAAVANSLRLVLRTFPSAELPDAASGAAAALAQAGWCLRYDPTPSKEAAGPTWADLRTSIHPHQAAAAALVAAGLWVTDLALIRVGDVSEDGTRIQFGGTEFRVPAGAVLYVVAQRLLAADEADAYFTHRGYPLNAKAIERAVAGTLAEAGRPIDGRLLYPPRTRGLRWLAARGLTLDRMVPMGEPIRMAPRCRHGIAAEFEVDGVLLSHSKRLCHGGGAADRHPWEVRPASAGFALEETERTAVGIRIAVMRHGDAAGELVGLNMDDGPVWLQVGVGSAPGLRRIAEAVADRYDLYAVTSGS